jgi:hypothetical protein
VISGDEKNSRHLFETDEKSLVCDWDGTNSVELRHGQRNLVIKEIHHNKQITNDEAVNNENTQTLKVVQC